MTTVQGDLLDTLEYGDTLSDEAGWECPVCETRWDLVSERRVRGFHLDHFRSVLPARCRSQNTAIEFILLFRSPLRACVVWSKDTTVDSLVAEAQAKRVPDRVIDRVLTEQELEDYVVCSWLLQAQGLDTEDLAEQDVQEKFIDGNRGGVREGVRWRVDRDGVHLQPRDADPRLIRWSALRNLRRSA